MKKAIKYMLLFSVIFCLKSIAQKPGDSKPLSDNTTFKGKVELWKEKKVLRHERNLDKKNERKARKKNTSAGLARQEVHRKKHPQERNKPKPAEEKVKH